MAAIQLFLNRVYFYRFDLENWMQSNCRLKYAVTFQVSIKICKTFCGCKTCIDVFVVFLSYKNVRQIPRIFALTIFR